jgi:hypothetical protein
LVQAEQEMEAKTLRNIEACRIDEIFVDSKFLEADALLQLLAALVWASGKVNVPSVVPQCSLNVPSMFPQCSSNVQKNKRKFSRNFPENFQENFHPIDDYYDGDIVRDTW